MTLFAFFLFIIYFSLSIYFWQSRWRQNHAISTFQRQGEQLILFGTLTLHAYTIFAQILLPSALYFSTSSALSVIAFIALMSYWLATFFIRLDGLQPILFSTLALLIASHLILPTEHTIITTPTALFKLHLTMAMLAYGLMLYAVWLALLIGIADRQLHAIKSKLLITRLPPLLTLENYLFSSISIGFILLSLALISGFSLSLHDLHHPFYLSHQTIFSLLSWGVFAILLWGRHRRGWRGRMAVNWVIIGFILLILGYFGSGFALNMLIGKS